MTRLVSLYPIMKYAKSQNGLIHLTNECNSEYTLCGDAWNIDSEEDGVEEGLAWVDWPRGPVTCPNCAGVILSCRRVRVAVANTETRDADEQRHDIINGNVIGVPSGDWFGSGRKNADTPPMPRLHSGRVRGSRWSQSRIRRRLRMRKSRMAGLGDLTLGCG